MNHTAMQVIADLMEGMPSLGGNSALAGAPQDAAASMPEMAQTEIEFQDDNVEEEEGFPEAQLKLAKRFIELVGSAGRARELLDKVADCEECLDIVDDDQSTINQLADSIPGSADFPTSLNALSMASLYNPGAVPGPY